MVSTKLTLTLNVPTYKTMLDLANALNNAGYHAAMAAPLENVWQVNIKSSPDTVNIGADMFDEIKQADIFCDDWLAKRLEALLKD